MLTRVKTFAATGLATAGRLYAGDLNAIQDAVAAISDFAQTIGASAYQIGDSSIQLLKFGAAEARVTAALRTDGILRALAGLVPGTYTTTQRDALVLPPTALVIYNSTNARLEVNLGTPGAPSWSPLAPTSVGAASVTTAMLQDGSVTNPKLASNAVTAAKVDGTLKPSVSAVPASEALRALGLTANDALPGNHFASTPVTFTMIAGDKTSGTYTVAAPVAGTYIIEWGAGESFGDSQGDGGTIVSSKSGSVKAIFSDVASSGGTALLGGQTLTGGEVITFTVAGSSGWGVRNCWAKLTRTA